MMMMNDDNINSTLWKYTLYTMRKKNPTQHTNKQKKKHTQIKSEKDRRKAFFYGFDDKKIHDLNNEICELNENQ